MACSGTFFVVTECHVGHGKLKNTYIEETHNLKGENVMESTLNTSQKKFVDMMLDDNIYTNEALAEACNVDVRTIYRYKRNADISAEINKLADASLGQFIQQANMKLIDVISNGSENGQLKAIEMLYKSLGKYKEHSEVTITETKTIDERKATLLSRLRG